MEGECLCGAIKVKVTEYDPSSQKSVLCHCNNCRKSVGGVYSVNMLLDRSNVTITGDMKVFEDPNTTSGTPVSRYFCPTCGNPIVSTSANSPGKMILKLGVFSQIPQPQAELFADERQEWEKPFEGATQVKGMSTPM